MKNIHVLPTDKPSRLFYNVGGALLFTDYQNYNGVNIYITSDEESENDDWRLKSSKDNIVILNQNKSNYKKIILTTDQDLIKDGVQAIDDEFLEWFVKNPSCEYIKTEKWLDDECGVLYSRTIPKEETKTTGDISVDYSIAQSKAIQKCMQLDAEMAYKSLPKQEELDCPFDFTSRCTMGRCDCKTKQETLEEVNWKVLFTKDDTFYNGAKWQQEQDKNKYSEEEVLEILNKRVFDLKHKKDIKTNKEWFEQFKTNKI